ncbi:phytoene dehydrogenase [Rhodoblastus sphagnicola]|uniref:Phytoene dehydrogenase n=1 Tax=Rhodoblastus sphagnicola TaxID=333368 RepID=A0A2S6NH58_9HYPH|nr:phytoene desaturase family protein [Rhodoblastus sphagnicola]MBB4200306.1 phytoene desaturase [Rhodoblastus sphagnicola]PPQ33931.1 phytoene dehydrogenase [Rhodoblastus sphagnicola]
MVNLKQSVAPAGAEVTRNAPHAVVIGGGFGGLAAAVRLGARGYRVTVLDRLDAPGGRAYVHHIDGFSFDAGPTIITAPFLLEELWALAGRRLEDDIDLRPMTPFYRLRFDDGSWFDCSGDPDAMRAEVARLSPEDVDGYEKFMELSSRLCRVGFENAAHTPFGSLMDMARVAPEMIAVKAWRSIYAAVCSYVRHPHLRVALSFHPLLIGGNPMSVSAIYGMISSLERRWGVHFAMGGTGALVRGLVSLIEGQGNVVRCGAEVTQILTKDRRAVGVRLSSGEEIAADIVVSNADAAWTYRYLLPAEDRRHWTDRKVEGMDYSNGLFVWYFGVNRRYDDVGHHTITLGSDYKGLLKDIFSKKVLSQDFSLYLHRPTATDPSLAPPGCDTFYVLSPIPHLDAKIDWATEAEPYRRAIAKFLDNTLLPGFEQHVVASRVTTPQDFHDRLLSFKGAGFGMEPVLLQSAYFRPHNKSEDVENLFLVGAGTHPGAGIPGVLSSAKVLDKVAPDASAFASAQAGAAST